MKTNTQPFADDLHRALEVLKQGGVILYPTDTIWGIGCDATNNEAVKRIYEIKHRVDSKALIVMTDTDAQIQRYVDEIPEMAWTLIEMTTKPLTIIYDKARNLAEGLIADDGSVAIRVTDEAFSKELCRRFGRPIVSTSANISGEPSPANFAKISPAIISAVDYVVKYRQEEQTHPKASSIIKLGVNSEIKIIRE